MESLIRYLTNDPDRTNALAAVANVFIALFLLVMATASIVLSFRALRHQVLHNKLSVKPIPFFALADHEESIRVRLVNSGSGPLIIKKLRIVNASEERSDLIDWMPDTPAGMKWTDFTGHLENRSILPGNELVLLHLRGSETDAKFVKFRNRCRKLLATLTGTIEYTDIYGEDFPSYSRSFDWFAR